MAWLCVALLCIAARSKPRATLLGLHIPIGSVANPVRNYLTACRDWQLPVLVSSMRRHCRPFKLWVLCWDFDPGDPGHDVLPITREQFLAAHPEQRQLPGPPRQTINLIDTARWRLAADLIACNGPLTYIDGDQWLFSSPEPVFDEIGDARMAVSPHRIPPASAGRPGVTLETHRKYGLYNSGWTYFADADLADELARACYEWSYCDLVERPGRRPLFGDQAHLEDVAERHGAHVIEAPGINVAPWNVHGHRLVAGKPEFNVPHLVDGQPLITYHFSSFRLGTDGRPAQFASAPYEIEKAPGAVDLLYRPYWEACLDAQAAAAGGRIEAP